MEDTSGFYKFIDDQWFFGPNAVRGPYGSWELLRELKDTYTYPYEGWTWYDEAPIEYIEWLNSFDIQ